MRGKPWAFAAAGLAVSMSGCRGSSFSSGPARTASADPALRQLMHDVAGSRQTCERLMGRMIALPAEGQGGGSAQSGGLALVSGRWAIRSCEAQSDGRTVSLKLGGLGWQWVDRFTSGFRVQQYVYFSASVDVQGQLDVGYDPAAHLASVWVTPVNDANVRVDALGNINARPEGFAANVAGFLGPAFGLNPDNIARARAGTEGAKQFRERLAQGMTVTYDTGRQQLDMVVGQLSNGVAPARPFTGPMPWLANERVLLIPGGFQLLGPFEGGGPAPALLFARVEQGAGLAYRAVCEPDVWNALDGAARGASTGPIAGAASSMIPPGYANEVPVQRPACRWLLAVSAVGPAPVLASLNLRAGGPAQGAGASSAWVRVTVTEFQFNETKPDGYPWDPYGGAPDPELVIREASGKFSSLAPMTKDKFRGVPMTSSGLVEVTPTSPLVIVATDVDRPLSADDPMGVATVPLQQLVSGSEISVRVMRDGVQTGTLRLRVELRPGP